MTQSKFQLVGSLLRPADLLDYKNKIEHRDDIQYPFYDSFPGYRETETAEIKKAVTPPTACVLMWETRPVRSIGFRGTWEASAVVSIVATSRFVRESTLERSA